MVSFLPSPPVLGGAAPEEGVSGGMMASVVVVALVVVVIGSPPGARRGPKERGRSCGPVTRAAWVGARTGVALARFQAANQIERTGQFNPATAYRLSCHKAAEAAAAAEARHG